MFSKRLRFAWLGMLSVAACGSPGVAFTAGGVADTVATGGQGAVVSSGSVAGGSSTREPAFRAGAGAAGMATNDLPQSEPTAADPARVDPGGGTVEPSFGGQGNGGATETPTDEAGGSNTAPQPDPLKCAQGCAGVGTCQAGVCVVTCSDAHPCTTAVSCPKGLACQILCQGEQAC